GRWVQRAEISGPLQGVGIDSRADLHGRAFVAVRGERHDGHDFVGAAAAAGAGMIVVDREPSAAVDPPTDVLLVDDTRKALGRLARAYRRTLPAVRVIAVTGSAGKTTTKMLIDAVLATRLRGVSAPKSFNNDIGVPLTVFSARPTDQYLIVEIGTNAPGEVGALGQMTEPDIAVITLAGHGHLEGLGSTEAVAREKLALAACLRRGGLAVVNADCPALRAVTKTTQSVVLYGESPDAHLRLTARGRDDAGWWIEVNQRHRYRLALPGRHNAMNALAAVAVGRRMGLDDEAIDEGLRSAEAPPMRLGRPMLGAVRLYNDAYNANPESMAAALETFVELEQDASRRVLVLGDMLELGEEATRLHEQLADRIIELDGTTPIDVVALVGTLTGHTARALQERWDAQRVLRVRQAGPRSRERIAELVKPGDAVLVKGSRALGLERLVPELEKHVADRSRRRRGGRRAKSESKVSDATDAKQSRRRSGAGRTRGRR
ncbi:MAG: UDP-N-acetylmuramoyl-tripeptide--D-alanyl-D-alanine ligase, partial [Planctomycetota bacterium]